MSDKQPNEPKPVDVRALTKTLTEPFEPALIKFKPQVVTGNRAMALRETFSILVNSLRRPLIR